MRRILGFSASILIIQPVYGSVSMKRDRWAEGKEGSRAALPVWGYFMRDILKNKPEREFVIPPEIMFKELLTVVADPREGPTLRPVREPIYAPFNGYTLVISPLDSFDTLADNIKAPLPLYTESGG